jgi:hypothetical protein
MECRDLLKEKLGIEAAFFDDCVGLAIQRVQRAEAALAESEARCERLREGLLRMYCESRERKETIERQQADAARGA